MELWKKLSKRYFIDAMGAMAFGLFASLLIGCIINTIGMYVPLLKDIVVNPWMSDKLAGENLLIASKTAAYAVQGAAMAAAIAYSMKAPPFVMYSTLAVGFAANALGAQGSARRGRFGCSVVNGHAAIRRFSQDHGRPRPR